MFQHYGGALDTTDVLGRNFGNKAVRVIREMWVRIPHYFTFFSPSIHNDCLHRVYMQDFFRVEPEYEEQANHIFGIKCVKNIKFMHYESCIQAIINYKAQYEHVKKGKEVARDTTLTKEQFMLVSNANFFIV